MRLPETVLVTKILLFDAICPAIDPDDVNASILYIPQFVESVSVK